MRSMAGSVFRAPGSRWNAASDPGLLRTGAGVRHNGQATPPGVAAARYIAWL
jgi:hypothetical protein